MTNLICLVKGHQGYPYRYAEQDGPYMTKKDDWENTCMICKCRLVWIWNTPEHFGHWEAV